MQLGGRRHERGSVLIVVAISLFAIMAIASLAIDGGLLYNDRRDDQNAADHAALAAAWAACNGLDPVAAGLASAQRNGFDNDGTSNTVTITALDTERHQAVITSTRDTAFAGNVDATQLDARASAVARCLPGGGSGGGYAIFAISQVCSKTIDWSGSLTDVTGAVHSNHDLDVGGSGNSVDGDTTYADGIIPSSPPGKDGVVNSFEPNPASGPVLADPLQSVFPISDFQPGGAKAVAAGTKYYDFTGAKIDSGLLSSAGRLNTSTGELDEGLYFTNRDIDLGNSSLHGTVTFVTSSGQLKISGSDQNLVHFDADGLLAYSDADRPCGEYGVAVSGSDSTWVGILYAPHALVEMSGSGNNNSTFTGSLVGDEVRLNGSNLDINFQNFGTGGGNPSVQLLE